LLVRKLRLLAGAGGTNAASSAMLEALASSMEYTLERAAGLETGMAVRDREIASRDLAISALKEEIAARDGHIASYRQWVEDRNVRIGDLEKVVAELNGHIDFFRREIAARDHHIAVMESTLSWRITAPIRFVGRLAKRVASALSSAKPPDR
jgi:uncharacterized protein (DUF3084 family)